MAYATQEVRINVPFGLESMILWKKHAWESVVPDDMLKNIDQAHFKNNELDLFQQMADRGHW